MTIHTAGHTGWFGKVNPLEALSGVTFSPRRWFKDVFPTVTPREAGTLLLLASLFYAAAGALPLSDSGALVRVGVLLVNALGMTVLHAGVVWLVGVVGGGPALPFARLWTVFAIGTCPTLLIAWIPFTFFFSEPWRWVLVALGMIDGMGIGTKRTVLMLLIAGMLSATMMLSILRLVSPSALSAF